MPFPPKGDAIATQFAGVVAGVEVDVPLVPPEVVKAVRDQLALPGAGEVVVQHFHRHLGMGVALPGEVADQLLFLGVDADHRVAHRQIPGLEPGDVAELGVAVGMGSQRFLLARLALAKAVPPHQLADCVPTRRASHLRQAAADFPPR
jgi:hypothetical protein